MKNVGVVWRTLADAALEGQRDWNSIGSIADAASVAPSTTHQALGRLVDIGAIRPNSRRGYTVADLGRRIVYTTRPLSQGEFPDGDEVIILAQDPVAARTWRSGYASLAQTYSDLWASPGWQAADFARALKAKLFADADWVTASSHQSLIGG